MEEGYPFFENTIDPGSGQVCNADVLESICQIAIREFAGDALSKELANYVNNKWDYPYINVNFRFSDKYVRNTFKAPTKRQIFSNLNRLMEEISDALKSGDIMCEPLDEIIDRIRGKMSENDSRSEKTFDPSLSDDVKRLREILSDCEVCNDAAGPRLSYWKGRLDRVYGGMRSLAAIRLGEFRSSKAKRKTGTITLYTTAIANSAKAQAIPFETVFFSTLIHEYFHALHYQLFKQQGIEDRWSEKWCDGERRIVQETLAAFYEWYSCEYGFLLAEHPNAHELASHLMENWESLDIDLWPYSGALVLADRVNNSPTLGKLFFRLLEMSFTNWSLAAKAIKSLYYMPLTGLGKVELDLDRYKP